MADKVTASAPGKLLLFGEHAVVHGIPCIVTAVSQRLYVTVELNGENAFHMSAPDLGLSAYSKTIDKLGGEGLPKDVKFIEVLYKRFLETYPQKRGIDVVTKSEFSSSFGFGSSSAATVAFAKALFKAYGLEASNRQLFELCYKTVLEVQGVGSGFDVAAAIWGGTLYYISPGKVIESIHEGDLPFVVGYTGVKADTPTLIRQVLEYKRKYPEVVEKIFFKISALVNSARNKIKDGDYMALGKLMNENQQLLSDLGVSSVELDRLNEVSLSAGAYGAKLSGAGGGDCMIAVIQQEFGDQSLENVEKIKKAISKHGELMDVKLGAEGVRLESNN